MLGSTRVKLFACKLLTGCLGVFVLHGLPAVGQSLNEIDREVIDRSDDYWTPTGYYIGGSFGLIQAESTNLDSINGNSPGADIEFNFDQSYGINAFVGTDYGMLRTEIEAGYRNLDIDDVRANGTPIASASGEVNSYSLMVNFYLDFPITNTFEFYIGGGVGGAYLDSNIDIPLLKDSTDVVFAYQAMAGLSLEVLPRLYLLGGYRIQSFSNPDFDGTKYDAPLVHGVDVGLRYVF